MQQPKIIFFVLIATVALVAIFVPWYNYSILGTVIQPVMPADWDNISNRNIVQYAILLSLVEEVEGKCVMHSERLSSMFEHTYFVRSMDAQKQLQYDEESQTIVTPCENIQDEQLRLHLRHIKQEAPKDGTKYEYTFTGPNIMMTDLYNSTNPQN